jgi:hypothetical protein
VLNEPALSTGRTRAQWVREPDTALSETASVVDRPASRGKRALRVRLIAGADVPHRRVHARRAHRRVLVRGLVIVCRRAAGVPRQRLPLSAIAEPARIGFYIWKHLVLRIGLWALEGNGVCAAVAAAAMPASVKTTSVLAMRVISISLQVNSE